MQILDSNCSIYLIWTDHCGLCHIYTPVVAVECLSEFLHMMEKLGRGMGLDVVYSYLTRFRPALANGTNKLAYKSIELINCS